MAQTHTPEESFVARSHLPLTPPLYQMAAAATTPIQVILLLFIKANGSLCRE